MDKQLLCFFLGSLFGFFASIGVEFFRFYFFRAKLRILNESKEIGEKFSCHSLFVKNIGKSIAYNSQGTITICGITKNDLLPLEAVKFIKDFGGNIEQLYKLFDVTPPETLFMTNTKFREVEQEPLAWSELESRRTMNIFPGMKRLLDVFRWVKIDGKEQIHIPSSQSWQAILLALKPNDYKITITVGCDNGSINKKKFMLKCNGDNSYLKEGW